MNKQTLLPNFEFPLNTRGNAERFLMQFRLVWEQIPSVVQTAIVNHWRDGIKHNGYLNVEYSNMWGTTNEIAQVRKNGMEVRFHQNDFEFLPNDAAQFVIAHELAHVYQKACGRPNGGESEDENEDHANKLAIEWGFNRRRLEVVKLLFQKGNFTWADACRLATSD